jgi:hypothetical protein
VSSAPSDPRRAPLTPHLGSIESIKLVGLGGVGGVVARYLSIFLASLGSPVRLVLIDGDEFEPKNAARMLFPESGNKAAVLVDELDAYLAESAVTLLAIEEYVTPDNVERLIVEGDVVLLCVDNHATRQLVNERVAALDGVCLISGGNDGVGEDSSGQHLRGTYGNVQAYLRRKGEDVTPSLVAFHPEIGNPADRLPTDLSCTDLLESVPQLLFTNLLTASAILNTLLLHLADRLHYSELAFDLADALMRPTPIPGPVRR